VLAVSAVEVLAFAQDNFGVRVAGAACSLALVFVGYGMMAVVLGLQGLVNPAAGPRVIGIGAAFFVLSGAAAALLFLAVVPFLDPVPLLHPAPLAVGVVWGALAMYRRFGMIAGEPAVSAARQRRFSWFALVGGCLGSVFLVVGAVLAVSTWIFVSGARATDGTVIALVEAPRTSEDDPGGTAPVVRYQVDGKAHEFRGVYISPPAYSVGETVRVLYSPDRPERAQIDSFVQLWLISVVFGGVGLVFVVVAVLGYTWRRGARAGVTPAA
jgi:hypothetical protein